MKFLARMRSSGKFRNFPANQRVFPFAEQNDKDDLLINSFGRY